MRILLVSQLYPGPDAPDLGVFVEELADELERQGHELDRVVLDRRGGSWAKYGQLGARALRRARAFRPDVVYAHFLVPAGALAGLAALVADAPLVVTAHGRDVRNVGSIPGVAAATRLTVHRAARVVAVSDYLRRELESKVPEARGKTAVVDCGVDLDRFHGRDPGPLRAALGWEDGAIFFLFVGSLDERKNVGRLVEAVERVDGATLAVVGDGPLRGRISGRGRVRLVGRIPHAEVADWIGACDVLCQPSLLEPFGQALLEAMASERSVVATRLGGPPEFVTPAAGVLVDPASVEEIAAGLEAAAALPRPNRAAREAAAEHDVRGQAARVAALLAEAVSESGGSPGRPSTSRDPATGT